MGIVMGVEKIPDLSGKVKLRSFRPVFNGNYSSVYQGKMGDIIVAVKVLKEINGARSQTMERKLRRECSVWVRLRHPNVLPLYGFANDHDMFHPFGAFISPWRTNGNASVYLNVHGKDMLMNERVQMWKGVVAGVAYLHSHNPILIHGDLKSANVLIDDDRNPQICDFGLISIYLEEGNSGMTTTSPYTGTDRYIAYELLHGPEMVAPTTRSDIFALGCIGLEFCFLQLPYAHRKNNLQGHIFGDIKAGKPPAMEPPNLTLHDNVVWGTLADCWTRDPARRPNANVLLTRVETLQSKAINPVRRTQRGQKIYNDGEPIADPRNAYNPNADGTQPPHNEYFLTMQGHLPACWHIRTAPPTPGKHDGVDKVDAALSPGSKPGKTKVNAILEIASFPQDFLTAHSTPTRKILV